MDKSRLNDLPAELRNRIYEYALHEPGAVAISKKFNTEPGLLRACKQTRHEAELIFHAINKFTAICPLGNHGTSQLISWLRKKQGKRLSLIKQLTIRIEAPGIDFESAWDSERLGESFDDIWYIFPFFAKSLDLGGRSPVEFFRVRLNGQSDEAEWSDGPTGTQSSGEWLQQYTCWVVAIALRSFEAVGTFIAGGDSGAEISSRWLERQLSLVSALRKEA